MRANIKFIHLVQAIKTSMVTYLDTKFIYSYAFVSFPYELSQVCLTENQSTTTSCFCFVDYLPEKMTFTTHFKGTGLNCIFHWKAHSCIFLRSLLKFHAKIFSLKTRVNKEVSSPKSLTSQFRSSDKSLIQIRKKRGLCYINVC